MTMRIVIDIETIPTQDELLIGELAAQAQAEVDAELRAVVPPANYKAAEVIDRWWAETGNAKKAALAAKAEAAFEERLRRTALDAAFGQVAVVGIKVEQSPPTVLYDTGSQYKEPGYEQWLLECVNNELRRTCGHHLGHVVIGHNLSFDRTFLRQRGIVRGVRMHELITTLVKPWDTSKFIDTMTLWTGDPRERVALDKLCRAFGIPVKGSELGEAIDGSKVWDFVRNGEIDKVATYCGGDCERTWEVYRRLNGLVDVAGHPYTPSWQRAAAPQV